MLADDEMTQAPARHPLLLPAQRLSSPPPLAWGSPQHIRYSSPDLSQRPHDVSYASGLFHPGLKPNVLLCDERSLQGRELTRRKAQVWKMLSQFKKLDDARRSVQQQYEDEQRRHLEEARGLHRELDELRALRDHFAIQQQRKQDAALFEQRARLDKEYDGRKVRLEAAFQDEMVTLQVECEDKIAGVHSEWEVRMGQFHAACESRLAKMKAERERELSHLKAERDLEKAAMTLESESSLARLMAKVEELQTSFVKEGRDRAEAESSLKAEFEERLRAQHSNLHASARKMPK